MGKVRWLPVLVLLALLASTAGTALGRTTTAVQTLPVPSGEAVMPPSDPGTQNLLGTGGSGGNEGDPDDLIDGNRAFPKTGASTTNVGGNVLTISVLWQRFSSYVFFLGNALR